MQDGTQREPSIRGRAYGQELKSNMPETLVLGRWWGGVCMLLFFFFFFNKDTPPPNTHFEESENPFLQGADPNDWFPNNPVSWLPRAPPRKGSTFLAKEHRTHLPLTGDTTHPRELTAEWPFPFLVAKGHSERDLLSPH